MGAFVINLLKYVDELRLNKYINKVDITIINIYTYMYTTRLIINIYTFKLHTPKIIGSSMWIETIGGG